MQDASSPDAADAPRLRAPRIAPAALDRHLAQSAKRPPPWLHEEIARRMDERLGLILRQPARLIDWWSPTSGGAPLLQARYPQARLLRTGLDGRPLEDEARGEGRWWQRLLGAGRTRPSSENEAPAELLWANMMLHWIDDRPALLARWHELIAVDGFLMFSCFGPDTLAELRTIWAEAGWGAPGSDWVDMHDLGDDLVQAGFADPVMDMERLTLTWDSPQALLAELRTLGLNTHPARQPGLRGRQWRRTLESTLTDRLRGPDGRLHLGFEIIYGHAFRPVARPRVEARTEISLDTMREMTRRRPASP